MRFSSQLETGGPLWATSGTYIVKVLYGSASRTAEVTFDYVTTVSPSTSPDSSFSVEGTNFLVSYRISGAEITRIVPDYEIASLIIELDTFDSGELTIELPRALIDSKYDYYQDGEYFVLVDGEEMPDFAEIATPTDRTLTISFNSSTKTIEIIGTH